MTTLFKRQKTMDYFAPNHTPHSNITVATGTQNHILGMIWGLTETFTSSRLKKKETFTH